MEELTHPKCSLGHDRVIVPILVLLAHLHRLDYHLHRKPSFTLMMTQSCMFKMILTQSALQAASWCKQSCGPMWIEELAQWASSRTCKTFSPSK